LSLAAAVGLGFATFLGRLRMTLPVLGIFLSGVLLEKQVIPHYLAPATVLLFLSTAGGLRILWHASVGNSRVRRNLGVMALGYAAAVFVIHNVQRSGTPTPLAARVEAAAYLNRLPGNHVVLIRYSPTHSPHAEFVFNGPDIDQQKIIWAFDRG